jgi:hypothetical protein
MPAIPVLSAAVLALGFLGAPSDKPKPPGKPKPPSVTCKLLTTEAPRGGRIEVEGRGFGDVPLVRIAGTITRILERRGDKIASQVPRDSDGGTVSVKTGDVEAECGTLTIIGKDR